MLICAISSHLVPDEVGRWYEISHTSTVISITLVIIIRSKKTGPPQATWLALLVRTGPEAIICFKQGYGTTVKTCN